MVWETQRASGASRSVWALAREQHGVVTRRQLVEAGLTRRGIEHRVARGRLHRVHRGVFAVGRPELDQHGWWMAAILACGGAAVLSHGSAIGLWGLGDERARRRDRGGWRDVDDRVHVSVPSAGARGPGGIVVHRRPSLQDRSLAKRDRIPVTSPAQTLIDFAVGAAREELESAVSEADLGGLIGVAALREELERHGGERGVARLRELIDRRTFRRSRSWLERHFMPLARRAGYPAPLTAQWVDGYEVDFFWPRLGLVVETDGGGFHRTPFQQTRDRRRDQAHTAAGLVNLRFTHGQIRYEPEYVTRLLKVTKRQLPAPGARSPAA